MDISILPGDLRQHYISYFLELNGVENKYIYSFENADVYIVPTPFTRDGIYVNSPLKEPVSILEFVEHLDDKSIVFSGGVCPEIIELLSAKSVKVFDYLKDSEMTLYNANLTANGLLHDIIEFTPFSLMNTKVLILGYGNCGKSIAAMLRPLVQTVNVYDHTERNMEKVIEDGLNEIYYNELEKALLQCNVVINTVPEPILTDLHLSSVNEITYFFEIASHPFGFQKELFHKYNLNLIYCPGLPGKYTPMCAGKRIATYIITKLKGCQITHDS